MLFLVEEFNLFKPSTWLSAAADGVMGTILSAIRTFCFWLMEIIYRLMVNVYNLFDHLCNARILDNDMLGEMSRRIGFILGLIMFFYIIFSFIQMMIDPEKITDKEKGAVSIVKKVVMVVLMLALYNTFFDILYGLQVKVINSNAISNIILPYTVAEGDKDRFGNLLSNSLIKAFYYIDDFEEAGYTVKEPETSDYRAQCQSLTNAFYNQIYNNNQYDIGYMCLNENIEIEKLEKDGSVTTKETYIINFDGIIAILAGGFTVYILVMYCFKIGVRMIQLAFLEIISPMAIISYLTPKKDNMLSKWWKIYFSTYIDVFIRIAIINFIIFLICTILSTNNPYGTITFWDSLGFDTLSLGEKSFYSVVIILALLTFAKKAPDLIKEIIGSSASKLGFGMAMKDIVGLEKTWKGTTGVLGGALGGAAVGFLGSRTHIGGLVGGLLKGGLSGLKGQGFTKTATSAWKNQQKTNTEMAKLRANGGNWFGYNLARIQHGLGIRTGAEYDEQRIADLEAEANLYNTASKEAESEAIKNGSNYIITSFDGSTRDLITLEKLANDQTVNSVDRAKYQAEYNQLLKSATMFNLDYGLAVEKGQVEFKSNGDFESLIDASTTVYTSLNDVDRIADKSKVIGNSNTTIEANMHKLAGNARQERGKRGKERRNENNNKVTRLKLSKQYKRNKANNGK